MNKSRSEPLHCSSGGILRIIVLLEGELRSVEGFLLSFLYLPPFILPSTWSGYPIPTEEKRPTPCFCMLECWGWSAVIVFEHTVDEVLRSNQKVIFWVSPDKRPFVHIRCVFCMATGKLLKALLVVFIPTIDFLLLHIHFAAKFLLKSLCPFQSNHDNEWLYFAL